MKKLFHSLLVVAIVFPLATPLLHAKTDRTKKHNAEDIFIFAGWVSGVTSPPLAGQD